MEKRLHKLTFWAINGALDARHLKEQLREMKNCGFDGTIFHPRYYPGRPPYMGEEYLAVLSETILYAKELGMEFWIYDENGWPSGSGDGKVREHFPERFCQWVVWKDGSAVIEKKQAFNTFDREQMQYFIRVVYDGYCQGLEPEAFQYVTGFFSDEVGFLDGHGVSMDQGGIPWCAEAEERMEVQFGETEKWLDLLFCEKEGFREVRSHYWEILTDILSESFYGAVNDWCEAHGKRYTAHLKGEENLFFQIPCSGSCFEQLKMINTPAVDALERYPGNHYYPRIASSVSRQFGDGECLAEALGGSGWGLTPENVTDYVDWLAECGINRFAFHLWQYERNSASVRDWPPNIPWGMNWKDSMAPLLGSLRRKWNQAFLRQENRCILVAPVRGCMASFHPEDSMVINEHNGAGTPDTESGRISSSFAEFVERMDKAGMDFDVTDERILEEYGVAENGGLRIGKAFYSHVIAGAGCKWEKKAPEFLWGAEDFSWSFAGCGPEKNQIPLEWKDNRVFADCRLTGESIGTDWRVRLLDRVSCLKVNGHILKGTRQEEGMTYLLPKAFLEDKVPGMICFEITPEEGGEPCPFAFLEGDFAVMSETPYVERDERQWLTRGSFYLKPLEDHQVDCTNLTASGFPFCRAGIHVRAKRYINRNGLLKLGKIEADCALVKINGEETGFVWGPEWQLETRLPEGVWDVELTLIPSTYNTYGPHHHRDGDRHVISPDQYEGKKNFADWPDAPENTMIPEWSLVKFGIR